MHEEDEGHRQWVCWGAPSPRRAPRSQGEGPLPVPRAPAVPAAPQWPTKAAGRPCPGGLPSDAPHGDHPGPSVEVYHREREDAPADYHNSRCRLPVPREVCDFFARHFLFLQPRFALPPSLPPSGLCSSHQLSSMQIQSQIELKTKILLNTSSRIFV